MHRANVWRGATLASLVAGWLALGLLGPGPRSAAHDPPGDRPVLDVANDRWEENFRQQRAEFRRQNEETQRRVKEVLHAGEVRLERSRKSLRTKVETLTARVERTRAEIKRLSGELEAKHEELTDAVTDLRVTQAALTQIPPAKAAAATDPK